jgi:hypothetical protein
MKKNILGTVIIVGVVCLIIGFYSGNVYGKNNVNKSIVVQNGTQGQFSGRNGGNGSGMMRNGGGFGGGTVGEVLSKDDKSITLKLRDGGSKIVFFGSSVPITHSVAGTLADVVIGNQIVVNGNTNTDGSVTATSIQIRPNVSTEPKSLK